MDDAIKIEEKKNEDGGGFITDPALIANENQNNLDLEN